jgi:hypothetical protein
MECASGRVQAFRQRCLLSLFGWVLVVAGTSPPVFGTAADTPVESRWDQRLSQVDHRK